MAAHYYSHDPLTMTDPSNPRVHDPLRAPDGKFWAPNRSVLSRFMRICESAGFYASLKSPNNVLACEFLAASWTGLKYDRRFFERSSMYVSRRGISYGDRNACPEDAYQRDLPAGYDASDLQHLLKDAYFARGIIDVLSKLTTVSLDPERTHLERTRVALGKLPVDSMRGRQRQAAMRLR